MRLALDGTLTDYWLDEYACHCCGQARIDVRTLTAHHLLTRAVGKKIVPNSAYRCNWHNGQIGGEKNSQHCIGCAVDLPCPAGKDINAFAGMAENAGFRSIGVYHKDNFLHCAVNDVIINGKRVARFYRA